MYSNFLSLPNFAKLITFLGVISPVLVFANLAQSQDLSLLSSLLVSFLSSVVIASSSLMLLVKKKFSRAFYFLGWLILTASPLLNVRAELKLDVFAIKYLFNTSIGVAIFIYLIANKNMKIYFSEKV